MYSDKKPYGIIFQHERVTVPARIKKYDRRRRHVPRNGLSPLNLLLFLFSQTVDRDAIEKPCFLFGKGYLARMRKCFRESKQAIGGESFHQQVHSWIVIRGMYMQDSMVYFSSLKLRFLVSPASGKKKPSGQLSSRKNLVFSKKSFSKIKAHLARHRKVPTKNSFGYKRRKGGSDVGVWFGMRNTHFLPPALPYSLSPKCSSDALRAWLSLDISVIVMHSRREH